MSSYTGFPPPCTDVLVRTFPFSLAQLMLKDMYVMQIEPVCRRMDVLIAWQSHRHHGIVVLCRTGECDGKCLIVRPDAAVTVVNLHTSASGRCPDGLALPSSGLTKRLLQGTGLPKPSLGALLKNDSRKVARHSHPAFSPCQQHDKSHSAVLSCPHRAKTPFVPRHAPWPLAINPLFRRKNPFKPLQNCPQDSLLNPG